MFRSWKKSTPLKETSTRCRTTALNDGVLHTISFRFRPRMIARCPPPPSPPDDLPENLSPRRARRARCVFWRLAAARSISATEGAFAGLIAALARRGTSRLNALTTYILGAETLPSFPFPFPFPFCFFFFLFLLFFLFFRFALFLLRAVPSASSYSLSSSPLLLLLPPLPPPLSSSSLSPRLVISSLWKATFPSPNDDAVDEALGATADAMDFLDFSDKSSTSTNRTSIMPVSGKRAPLIVICVPPSRGPHVGRQR